MTTSGLTRLGRRPERRSAAVAVFTALVLSAICWYFGADAWHSLLIGSAITAIAVTLWVAAAVEVNDTSWREARQGPAGSRHDVTNLSGSLRGDFGGVGHAAEWRLKQIARQRLTLCHLDLASPADRSEIEQLIGRRAYRLLVRSGPRRMRLRSLLHCLDALDRLDEARNPVQRPRSTGRHRSFTRSAPRRARGQ
jgi:hypothetical protein